MTIFFASGQCHGHPSKTLPHDDHIFIFDNATIHTKRLPGSLSARHMPKKIPKQDSENLKKEANWLVKVDMTNEKGRPFTA